MLRNQWDLGIYLNMTLLKVEQGHFFRLLLRFQVFGNIILNIFMIQTLCTVMQLFEGPNFSVDATSRHHREFWHPPSWPKERNDKAEVLAKREKKREVKRLLPFSDIFSLVPRRSIRYRSLDLTRTQRLPFPRRERRTLNVLRLTPN